MMIDSHSEGLKQSWFIQDTLWKVKIVCDTLKGSLSIIKFLKSGTFAVYSIVSSSETHSMVSSSKTFPKKLCKDFLI